MTTTLHDFRKKGTLIPWSHHVTLIHGARYPQDNLAARQRSCNFLKMHSMRSDYGFSLVTKFNKIWNIQHYCWHTFKRNLENSSVWFESRKSNKQLHRAHSVSTHKWTHTHSLINTHLIGWGEVKAWFWHTQEHGVPIQLERTKSKSNNVNKP